MFTGLVEALGTVVEITAEDVGRQLVIQHPLLAAELTVGESVAVNGACLTVVDRATSTFAFQMGPETLRRTNLGELHANDRVNLERSLRVGARLGGHFVQGHIDAVGHIADRQRQGDWELVWFSCPAELTRWMVPKGSIAVDGVSLTLVDVADDRFSVALIPFTLEHTTLGHKPTGATVNLEADLLAKYVEKLLRRDARGEAQP